VPETNIIFFFSQRVQVKEIRATQRNLQGFRNLQLSFTHCDYQFQLTSITVESLSQEVYVLFVANSPSFISEQVQCPS
jgi:hypothetical protein